METESVSDEIEINDGVVLDEDTNVSYESDKEEYVQKFKAHFAQDALIKILSPNAYKEVGLQSFEVMMSLMHPSERRGSVIRYIARVKIGDSVNYYLIKGVRNLVHGDNEVKIGNALRSLNILTCVGAVFGFPAASTEYKSTLYYVVVPWIIGTIPLDSFIRNNKPEEYNLSTRQCIRLFYPVLRDLVELWKTAKFSHMDCKLDQVLFVSTASYQLLLVDFGLSSIDVKIEGNRIKVETRHISQSRVWLEDFCDFLKIYVHQFITCKCSNRDTELIKLWNKNVLLLRKLKIKPAQFLSWMEGV